METLDLSQLLHLIDEMPAYRQLVEELEFAAGSTRVTILEAAKPFLVAALYHRLQRPLVMVTAQPDNARKLYDQLMTWCGCEEVRLFPEPDTLPYERVISDTPSEQERLQVLSALVSLVKDRPVSGPPMVVASASAFIQKTTSRDGFTASFQTVKVGMEVEPIELLERWQAMGYRTENIVEVPGTAGRRGGVIDIYPMTAEMPARFEFFGNSIESIRLFDPASQRSQQHVPSITIGPATELLAPLLGEPSELKAFLGNIDVTGCNEEVREQYQRDLAMLIEKQRPVNFQFYAPLFNRDSLLDYLPDDAVLVLDEPRSIELAATDFDVKSEELRIGKLERGELPVDFPKPHFTWEELKRSIESRQNLVVTAWGAPDTEEHHRLDFTPAPNYAGQLPAFIERVKEILAERQRIIVVSHQASRLSELFTEQDIIAPPLAEVKQPPQSGSLTLVQGLLDGGWATKGSTVLLTDTEIFGFVKQQRLLKKRPVPRRKLAVDIKPGDYVVHVEHGIAEFTGFRMMRTEHGEKEFLVLRYASGDRLYVPSDQIDRVGRYIGGSGDQAPVLSRLGTQEWIRTKQKVKESVEEMAEKLLSLYAARDVVPGFAFSPDTLWQRELEASFPYVETPDQIEVQGHVKEDMERGKPMDRIVCGDVGYGKTEVALRAAFKAVLDGKQVAVLVPTTVLAQQHYSTFKERLEAFPVTVEVLSRFRSPREQQVIVDGLVSGRVDICIGTHRLIQKDVSFKQLGLLIIDEEQRFGVAHKEYLKQIRQEVDVLTLSATPIPRTLHMALTGVRDMSTMETPPEERLPIKTYVAEYNERLIREAVLREMERNGQVFFVHKRVQSIPIIAAQLAYIIPEARVAIAHGQMPEHELEQVTTDFINDKSDILLCTTIIESGLDMPNVNTLIVNRADRFGLTQLYQLRGRVGRGAKLAYAYFLFDPGQNLTPIAEKRLRTIYEATELGAGFGIAMKDLEIRGAGTLLGTRQSGHITAVGFHLYTQLLTSAVEKLKAKRAGIPETEPVSSQLPMPTIDLPLSAFIPEEYVTDLLTRLDLYQDMVKLDRPDQIDNLAADFKDRFGLLPPEVENLLYAARVRLLAARAYIESVTTERSEIVLRLVEGLRFDKQKLQPVLRDGIRVGNNQLGLSRRRLGREWRDVLVDVLKQVG
jgi:transcription-repair coupling factor (superfamily II helicase)